MIECRLEHFVSDTAKLTEPEVIAPLPEGVRANVYVTRGEISGLRLSGKPRRVGDG
jgi:hypothetical protein